MKAINLTLGKHYGQAIDTECILILADNGTPLFAVEKYNGTFVAIHAHTTPGEMEEFMARHGVKISLKVDEQTG